MCIAVTAFLLALGMTLYPVISTRYNEKHQSEIHTQYQEQVEQVDTSAIEKARELAIAYNEAIQPGAQLTEAFSNDALLWASEDYKNQLVFLDDPVNMYNHLPEGFEEEGVMYRGRVFNETNYEEKGKSYFRHSACCFCFIVVRITLLLPSLSYGNTGRDGYGYS